MKKFKITKTEIGVAIAIVALAVFIVFAAAQLSEDVDAAIKEYQTEQEQTDKTAYDAWVKVTGNKKELTYEEWKALSDKGLLPKEEKGGGTDGQTH